MPMTTEGMYTADDAAVPSSATHSRPSDHQSMPKETEGVQTGDDAAFSQSQSRPSDTNTYEDSDINSSRSMRGGEENATRGEENQNPHAQETFSGAPEPEPISDVEEKRYGPTGSGVGDSPAGAGVSTQSQTGATGTVGSESSREVQAEQGEGKLPFKEQVKAYAKVHRGTVRLFCQSYLLQNIFLIHTLSFSLM